MMNRIFSRTVSMSAPFFALSFFLSPNVSLGQGIPAMFGQLEYRANCASCHGPEGKGDGPVASELKVPPANLQLISKNNDGIFPADEVYEIIDGRKTVRAHGTSEMPVWGDTYSATISAMRAGGQSAPPTRERALEATIHGRILSLVYYIQSLQVE